MINQPPRARRARPRRRRRRRRRLPVALAAVLAAAAIAGCGDVTPTASQALDSAAKLSRDAADISHQLMHRLCPAAEGNATQLTPKQATGCVDRVKKAYLDFLKARGYDPQKIANGTN